MSATSLLWADDSSIRQKLVLTVVLAVVVASGLAWTSIQTARPVLLPKGEFVLVRGLSSSHDKFDLVGIRGDGQFFVAIARDPSLSRPKDFALGDGEAAYRAQRPLMSYAAWLLGGGQPDAIAIAIQVVSVLAAALAAIGVALLPGVTERWRPIYTLVVLVAGCSTIIFCTSELLGLMLALFGVRAWSAEEPAERRLGLAVLCFALAGLTRETMLLVPFAMLLWGLVNRCRPAPRHELALAASALPYLAWSVVVRWRYHAWAQTGHPGGFSLPLVGIFRTAPHWNAMTMWFAMFIGVVAVAACSQWRTLYGFIAVTYGVLGLVLGDLVWGTWMNASRVLLPLAVFGLVALLLRTPVHSATDAIADEGSASALLR